MHASIRIVALVLAATMTGCTRDGGSTTNGTDAAMPATTASSPVTSTGGDPAPAPSTAPGRRMLALSGEGLDLVERGSGAIRHLAFGVDTTQAVDALTRVRGAPQERFDNPECGAGPLQTVLWADGLSVQFQDGRFVGWGIHARGKGGRSTQERLATVAGIGLGSTRAELEAAYATQVFQSTLGTEFSTGRLFGLLESPRADAKVASLWAGTVCIFR